MSEIVILGSGAGFATKDRFNTSIALLSGNESYILDCGEPCATLVYRNGIDPLSIRGIFISHMHPDHIGGLPQLLFSIYLPLRSKKEKHRPWSIHSEDAWYTEHLSFPPSEVRKKCESDDTKAQITLAVPKEAVDPLKAFLTSIYLMDQVLPFELQFVSIGKGSVFKDENIDIAAHPNNHIKVTKLYSTLQEKYSYLNMESYSFVVNVENKKMVYSGDINSLDELSPLLAGTELLILEVAHISPEDIFSFLQDKDVKRIILTHIHPALEGRVKKAFSQSTDKRIILARDGLRIHV